VLNQLGAQHKTLRVEFLTGKVFAEISDIADAQAQLDVWVEHYNHVRLHQSLGMATPWDRFKLARQEPTRPVIETTADPAGDDQFRFGAVQGWSVASAKVCAEGAFDLSGDPVGELEALGEPKFDRPADRVRGSIHSSRSSSVVRSRFTRDEAAREVSAAARRTEATIVDVAPSGIW